MEGNEVQFYGMKPSRHLVKEVKRRIEKWIQREQGWLYCGKAWRYSVEIEQVGSPHYYQCFIFLQTDAKEWSTQGSGRSFQDSITNALKNLHEERAIKTFTSTWSYA